MTQLMLNGKELTPLLRLQQLRLEYYNQYIEDIKLHRILLRQKTETYKNTVKSLDTQIEKEKRKSKNKKNC